jgi:pimeloyl-ACP methyl ester carboxylesterase
MDRHAAPGGTSYQLTLSSHIQRALQTQTNDRVHPPANPITPSPMKPVDPTPAAAKKPRWAWAAAGLLPITAILPSCGAGQRDNPSFPLTVKKARAELGQMRSDPAALRRPVVVLGGWGDVMGFPPAHLAEQLRLATGDDRVLSIGFGGCMTFNACRGRVLKRIEAAFPSDSTEWTTQVDVVGFSMGGLVARYTAAPTDNDSPTRRLRIARLYTISTPHQGALMSRFVAPGALAKDMRAGSTFLRNLDRRLASADYDVVPYVRLGDTIVGAPNAAPRGQNPWWLPARPFSRSHTDAYRDPRLIADLARRLRNETPYTTEPAAPVPE